MRSQGHSLGEGQVVGAASTREPPTGHGSAQRSTVEENRAIVVAG